MFMNAACCEGRSSTASKTEEQVKCLGCDMEDCSSPERQHALSSSH